MSPCHRWRNKIDWFIYLLNYGPACGWWYLSINCQSRSEWEWMRVWLSFWGSFLCPIVDFLSQSLAQQELGVVVVIIAVPLLLLHPIPLSLNVVNAAWKVYGYKWTLQSILLPPEANFPSLPLTQLLVRYAICKLIYIYSCRFHHGFYPSTYCILCDSEIRPCIADKQVIYLFS